MLNSIPKALIAQLEKDKIVNEIKSIIPKNIIFEGRIGGPSEILDHDSPEVKMLKDDISKFITF